MSEEQLASIRLSASQVLRFEEPLPLEEVITRLASSLEILGYVRDSFRNAIFEREKVFPTGLPTEPIGVAIPHTDAEHVITDAMAIGVLHEPVQFKEMGTSNGESLVDVSLVTMLAISDPKGMVPLLSRLARCYQDGEFLEAVFLEKNIEKIMELFRAKVPQIEINNSG